MSPSVPTFAKNAKATRREGTNISSVPGAHGRAQILALCLGTREGTASAVPLSRSDSVRALAPAAKKFDSVPFFRSLS